MTQLNKLKGLFQTFIYGGAFDKQHGKMIGVKTSHGFAPDFKPPKKSAKLRMNLLPENERIRP